MLDPAGRAEVLAAAHRLQSEEGIAIVWITHDMQEAATAERMIVLSDGLIALEGAPRSVFQRAEELRALGLDVPPMMELARRLNEKGLPVKNDAMTVEEMVVELCRLRSGI